MAVLRVPSHWLQESGTMGACREMSFVVWLHWSSCAIALQLFSVCHEICVQAGWR